MKTRTIVQIGMTSVATALLGLLAGGCGSMSADAPASAPRSQSLVAAQDSLYIGDVGDNAVKKFDAATGAFVGAFVKQSLAGLHGPRGLVFDASGAGIPTYGHSGFRSDVDDVRAHRKDERMSVYAFYDGTEYLYRLVRALAGGRVGG